MRSSVVVRPADPDDVDVLVALCLEARAESSVGPQLCSGDADRLRHQVAILLAEPASYALVAMLDGELGGLLLARVLGPTVFTDEVSLTIEAVYVGDGYRRRGLGHSLLAAAVEEAQRVGATDVVAAPLPGARGMQRFLARLGFAPAAAHRVASTSALQRRLAGEGSGAPRGGLEDLIARRRRTRAANADDAAGQPADGAGASAASQTAQTRQRRRASISMHVSRAVQTRRARESWTTIS